MKVAVGTQRRSVEDPVVNIVLSAEEARNLADAFYKIPNESLGGSACWPIVPFRMRLRYAVEKLPEV